jgi:very-short-patch-repair endonuclease
MDERLEELLELGPLRVRAAVAEGIPRSELRSRRMQRPLHGVRARTQTGLLEAVAERLEGHQFISHIGAARLWRMRLPRRFDDRPVDVSALLPEHAPRTPGVIPHRLDEKNVELALVDGVRVTTPTETWRHLSTLLSIDELVIAGDSLVQRRQPLATMPQLRRAVARHAGGRGVRRLRVAYDLVRPATDSASETRLRLMLARAGLPEPVVNLEVDLPGYGQAFCDLAYPDWLVGIEYDGWQHQRDPEQFARDILRHEAFAAAGWRMVRVLFEHMATPDAVAARVRAALRASDHF